MTDKVLIAGSGIIGGILGKILQKNNVPFQILEKNLNFNSNPNRTVALTKESVIFLNSLDKNIDLNEWATPIKKMNLYKDQHLNLELFSNETEKLSTVCSLDELQKRVFSGIEDNICWGEEIKNIKQSKKQIVINTNKNKREGSFLFAADGINSKVRSLLGFETEEWFYGQKAYVSKVPANHKNIAHQYFTESGTIALLPYTLKKDYFSIIFCTNTTLDPSDHFKKYVQDFNIEINLSELDDFKGGFDLKHLRIKNMHKEKVLMCGLSLIHI